MIWKKKNIKIGQKEGVQKDPMIVKQKQSTTFVRKDNDVLSGPKIIAQEDHLPKSNVVTEPTKTMEILERVDLIDDEGKASL